MNRKFEWVVRHRDTDAALLIEQVDELVYPKLTVPVWHVVEGHSWAYSGRFVRNEDLPADLAEAFLRWMMLAAIPFHTGVYDYDFTDFMARRGRGWTGDFSEVVNRYF